MGVRWGRRIALVLALSAEHLAPALAGICKVNATKMTGLVKENKDDVKTGRTLRSSVSVY